MREKTYSIIGNFKFIQSKFLLVYKHIQNEYLGVYVPNS